MMQSAVGVAHKAETKMTRSEVNATDLAKKAAVQHEEVVKADATARHAEMDATKAEQMAAAEHQAQVNADELIHGKAARDAAKNAGQAVGAAAAAGAAMQLKAVGRGEAFQTILIAAAAGLMSLALVLIASSRLIRHRGENTCGAPDLEE